MSKASASVQTAPTFGDLEVFGKNEINADLERPKNPKPAWYFTMQMEELQEDIRRDHEALKRGAVHPSRLPGFQAKLAIKEDKLASLLEAMPRITEMQLEKLGEVFRELSDKIRETLFTRSDMMKGIADPHVEATRMSRPVIELRGDAYIFVKACCGSHVFEEVKGKAMVSRTNATNAWQIAAKILGENTNVEILRKDG